MNMDLLPHDEMIEVCETLDIKTLGRFMASHSRAYQICSKVLLRKKIESLRGTWKKVFTVKGDSMIYITTPRNYLYIIHDIQKPRIFNPKLVNELESPILPDMRATRNYGGSERYSKLITHDDKDLIDLLYDNLMINGYHFVE